MIVCLFEAFDLRLNPCLKLVKDLALPVPATLICEMLGVPPEEQATFTQWTTDATHGLTTLRGIGDVAKSLIVIFAPK